MWLMVSVVFWRARNFGDALNNHLFRDYFGLDVSENVARKVGSTYVFGIGTILGQIPTPVDARQVFVFTSGLRRGLSVVGKEKIVWIAVRGSLTAKALSLAGVTLGDGAYLIPELFPEPVEKRYPFSFIPHVHTLRPSKVANWPGICRDAKLHFIDPSLPVDVVIDQIKASEVVLAEAMHGAIVADAFRVPWIPVEMCVGFDRWKWYDFVSVHGKEHLDVLSGPKLYWKVPVYNALRRRRIGRLGVVEMISECCIERVIRWNNDRNATTVSKFLRGVADSGAAKLSNKTSHRAVTDNLKRASDKLRGVLEGEGGNVHV